MFKMKNILFSYCVLILIILSCKGNNLEENNPVINKKVLFFKDTFLTENGDDTLYDKLEKRIKERKIEVRYLNDLIYVSFIDYSNACSENYGDILIKNHTIKLLIKQKNNLVCTSTSIRRFSFIINNYKEEKFKFVYY